MSASTEIEAAQIQPTRQHPDAARGPCVLLAEDDAAMRVLLASRLRRHGYEVLIAEDGLQLVQQVELCLHRPPASPLLAIVSDVRMPGIDGLRALESLRSHGYDLPVILITAFGTAGLHAEAKKRGAAAMLDKPFEIDHLLAIVDGLFPQTMRRA